MGSPVSPIVVNLYMERFERGVNRIPEPNRAIGFSMWMIHMLKSRNLSWIRSLTILGSVQKYLVGELCKKRG